MTPFLGELVGTTLLLYLGCGVNANVSLHGTYGRGGGWIVTAFGWAMAVFVGVFVSAEASGAHLNPAVTLALTVSGKFAVADVPLYLVAQLLGGMLGATLAWLQYRPHYAAEEDPAVVLGTFATGPAIRDTAANFMSEVVATCAFVVAVLSLTAPNLGTPDGRLGSLDALPVAFVVLAIGLSAGGTTGYAINPARDLGPRLAHALLPIPGKGGSDWAYSWIPVVGPLLGAGLAAFLYTLIAG